MQAIANWLKNGTYEDGVRLYEQHGNNSFLKTKFKAGANDYNVAKLREELAAIGAVESQNSKFKIKNSPESNVERTTSDVQPSTPDQAKKYLQLCNKRDKLYRTLNMLMEQKHHLPEGDDLRKCGVAILTTHQQITECWAAVDYYQQHGKFVDDDAPVKPELPLKKEMQLLRQTISKAKKRLDSPSCRDREQTQQLLAVSRNKLARLVDAKKASHDK